MLHTLLAVARVGRAAVQHGLQQEAAAAVPATVGQRRVTGRLQHGTSRLQADRTGRVDGWELG